MRILVLLCLIHGGLALAVPHEKPPPEPPPSTDVVDDKADVGELLAKVRALWEAQKADLEEGSVRAKLPSRKNLERFIVSFDGDIRQKLSEIDDKTKREEMLEIWGKLVKGVSGASVVKKYAAAKDSLAQNAEPLLKIAEGAKRDGDDAKARRALRALEAVLKLQQARVDELKVVTDAKKHTEQVAELTGHHRNLGRMLSGPTEPVLDGVHTVGFTPRDPKAKEGLDLIFELKTKEHGMPLSLFNKLNTSLLTRATVDQQWQTLGTLPDIQGRNPKIPSMTVGQSVIRRNGEDLVTANCFTCHSGIIAGNVYAGVPNNDLNFSALHEQGKTFVEELAPNKKSILTRIFRDDLSEEQKKRLNSFRGSLSDIVLKSSVDVRGTGANTGHLFGYRQLTRLKNVDEGFAPIEDFSKSELEEKMFEGYLRANKLTSFPHAKPQPWWLAKHKERFFWLGDMPASSVTHVTLEASDDRPDMNKNWQKYEKEYRAMMEYLKQLEAPPFPDRDLVLKDEALVKKGHEVYSNTCARCHGRHDIDGKLVKYGNPAPRNVGTDPEYAKLVRHLYPLTENLYKSGIAKKPEDYPDVQNEKGYLPPPLVGIWARAPYFHNGSVPNLEMVLDSKKRAEVWEKSQFPHDYDLVNGGVVYRATWPSGSDEKRRIDTKLKGWGNGGHTFGDDLSKEERKALLAFLKLL